MTAHISIPMYRRMIAQRYRLEGQKCTGCGKINFPPKGICRHCRIGYEFIPVELCGRGKIYSYTIVEAAGVPPEFEDEAIVKGRYAVAIINLEEGPHISAQMVNCDPLDVFIGMDVEVVTRKIYLEEQIIRYGYKFRPVVIS